MTHDNWLAEQTNLLAGGSLNAPISLSATAQRQLFPVWMRHFRHGGIIVSSLPVTISAPGAIYCDQWR
jgi:hypothetical protein